MVGFCGCRRSEMMVVVERLWWYEMKLFCVWALAL